MQSPSSSSWHGHRQTLCCCSVNPPFVTILSVPEFCPLVDLLRSVCRYQIPDHCNFKRSLARYISQLNGFIVPIFVLFTHSPFFLTTRVLRVVNRSQPTPPFDARGVQYVVLYAEVVCNRLLIWCDCAKIAIGKSTFLWTIYRRPNESIVLSRDGII